MTNILYIGNNLTKKSKYNSTLTTLSNLLINEGYTVTISSNKKNKIIRLLSMCLAIIKNYKNIDYILIDTFSTTNFYYAYVTSQLAIFFKIPYIPILHGGNLPERLKHSPKMCKAIFMHSKVNISPSNYLKLAFEKHNFKVDVIPNIIEINNYTFKERTTFKPTLLWVRAFDKTYNPFMAIKVLHQLKKEYPKALLCMIGPQKDETLLATKKLIKELDLVHCVEITGVLPKEKWHQKSMDFDIFINTTNFDNTPVSVIEAMALGLPIVSTNVGGIPFLIDDKKNGLLVNKNDVDTMVKSIKNIIENPIKTTKMINNSKQLVENFDWKSVRNKWLNILS